MKNANHPKKGDRIAVDPIRNMKDIKAIMKILSDKPRDRLLFIQEPERQSSFTKPSGEQAC